MRKFDLAIQKLILEQTAENVQDEEGNVKTKDELNPFEGDKQVVEPEKITSEGKKFLVSLILKALAINPDNISEYDKAIFNAEVSTDNADAVLEDLVNIIEKTS